MIELHILGDTLITVNGKEVRPSSPMMFAALLYLCADPGRRVTRTSLQGVLFPRSGKRGGHSLRQLLYKLRSLGVPLQDDATTTRVPADAVQPIRGGRPDLGILPEYSGDFSPPFREWLESYRSRLAAELRTQLLSALSEARLSGDPQRTLAAADGLLAIDPLNEEATLAHAEALALSGQKLRAVQELAAYAEDVGSTSVELRLSADILRKRITSRTELAQPRARVLGRSNEIAELLSQTSVASRGENALSIVVGDPGIGKSALLDELQQHLALRPLVVECARCSSHDSLRPMGVIIDLLPRLLKARGALAIAPQAMGDLQTLLRGPAADRTIEPSDIVSGRISAAVEDLLQAVCAEKPLCLLVDDAQWIDAPSLTLLTSAALRIPRLHVVLASRVPLAPRLNGPLPRQHRVLHLGPLADLDATNLLNHLVATRHDLPTDLTAHCVALAAGNPLFLCTIADHLRLHGAIPPSRATIADLLRQRLHPLSPKALLLLRFISAFGVHCTPDRLFRSSEMPRDQAMLALQELFQAAILSPAGSPLRCAHDLITAFVVDDTPLPLRQAIAQNVADELERDGIGHNDAGLLWASATCYRDAGLNERAAEVLVRCAQTAAAIGQPAFAIDALEKAQELAPENAMESIVSESLRIADEACDNEAVLRNAAKLASWRSSRGLVPDDNPIAQLALINARRRAMQSVWKDHASLMQCLLDSEALPSDRLKAARVFLLIAEEQMERTAGEEAYAVATRHLKHLISATEWTRLELAYHGAFGDLDLAEGLSRELIGRRKKHPRSVGLVAYGHAGFLIFRAGAPSVALSVYEDLLHEAERIRINPFTWGNYAGHAAMMALHSGEPAMAQRLQVKAKEILAQTGDADRPIVLANEVDLAINRGDAQSGITALRMLSERYPDCFTPNRERIAVGQEIILNCMEGKQPNEQLFGRALELYRIGRNISECDTLATAISIALPRSDALGPQPFLEDYLHNHRRDRYPLPPFHLALQEARGSRIHHFPAGAKLGKPHALVAKD